MRDELRRNHETGTRVFEFANADPTEAEGYTVATTTLAKALPKALELDRIYFIGLDTARASTESRAEAQQEITSLVATIGIVSRATDREEPGFHKNFRVPREDRSVAGYNNRAQLLLERVRASADRFAFYGFTPAMADELESRLARWRAGVTEGNTGHRTHVTATSDIEDVIRTIRRAVEQLNVVYQVRYRQDPVRLAAWNAARAVRRAPARKDAEAPDQATEAKSTSR